MDTNIATRRILRGLAAVAAAVALLALLAFVITSLAGPQPTARIELRLLVGTRSPVAVSVPLAPRRLAAQARVLRSRPVFAGACLQLPPLPPDGTAEIACITSLQRRAKVAVVAGLLALTVRAGTIQVATDEARGLAESFLVTSAGDAAVRLRRAARLVRAASGPRQRARRVNALTRLANRVTTEAVLSGPVAVSGHPWIVALIAAALAALALVAVLTLRPLSSSTGPDPPDEMGQEPADRSIDQAVRA